MKPTKPTPHMIAEAVVHRKHWDFLGVPKAPAAPGGEHVWASRSSGSLRGVRCERCYKIAMQPHQDDLCEAVSQSAISSDPKRMGGRPTIGTSRVTVEQMLAELGEGRSLTEWCDDMDIPLDDAKAALAELCRVLLTAFGQALTLELPRLIRENAAFRTAWELTTEPVLKGFPGGELLLDGKRIKITSKELIAVTEERDLLLTERDRLLAERDQLLKERNKDT
jgi:uncharacterized protein (DUF433 family)